LLALGASCGAGSGHGGGVAGSDGSVNDGGAGSGDGGGSGGDDGGSNGGAGSGDGGGVAGGDGSASDGAGDGGDSGGDDGGNGGASAVPVCGQVLPYTCLCQVEQPGAAPPGGQATSTCTKDSVFPTSLVPPALCCADSTYPAAGNCGCRTRFSESDTCQTGSTPVDQCSSVGVFGTTAP
jgi:hypothetical protein